MLLCVISFIILGIKIAIFGEGSSSILMMEPFTSGFLHVSFSHFGYNMIMLFLVLLSPFNSTYDITKIFWITFLLSVLYLPVSILGITPPAVGISGTCYFLLARYLFSWEKNKKLGQGIMIFLVFCEIVTLGDLEDKIAHGVHILGAILGYLSLKTKNMQMLLPEFIFKRIA